MSFSRRQFLRQASVATLAAGVPRVLRSEDKIVLRVGTFYGYEDSVAVKQFSQDTGIQVDFIQFENTEDVVAELVRNQLQLDIAITSHFLLPHLATLGLIQPLRAHWLPKLSVAALDKRFAHFATIRDEWFSWPNDWGTTGIIYHRDRISIAPNSWQEFFALIPDYKRRVSLPDDQQTVVGTALKSLGYSFNETRPDRMLEAAAVLRHARPYIRSLDSDTEQTMKTDAMNMGWSDSAYVLHHDNPAFEFILPPEGGELWSDWYAISSRCHDVRAAHEFLNNVLSPDSLARDVIANGWSPVDNRVLPLLPDEVRQSPAIFPSNAILKNMELATQETLREPLRGEIYAQFKNNKWN